MAKEISIYDQIKQGRHFKLAYVSGDMVLNWFTYGIGQPTSEISSIKGVPDGTIVMGVDYDIEYAAFVFLLGNLEFESLEMGVRPEILNITTKWVGGK